MSSFGLSIEKFYCCGHLKSVSLSLVASEKNKCGKDGATSGCCKSKFQTLKVKDNHILSTNIAYHKTFSFVPSLRLYEPIGAFKNFTGLITSNYYSPPQIPPSIPLYISNLVFRI